MGKFLKTRGKFNDMVFVVTIVAVVLTIIFVSFSHIRKNVYSISVTVSMSSFSPNPLKLNTLGAQGQNTNFATSSLSADYDTPSYNCDPTFDTDYNEGKVTEQYDWTINAVQYKPTWAGSYGQATNYAARICPSQPSSDSGATLVFRPLWDPGYWQVSVSCSVTVTDNATGQSWSGNANAGPEELTSYVLDIIYGGNIVDSQTQNASVGQLMDIYADYGPSDMTLQWTVHGSTYWGYIPEFTPVVFNQDISWELSTPSLSFYWMDTDSGSTHDEQITLKGMLLQPQQTVSVSTTFNVYRPHPCSFGTQYIGMITYSSPYIRDGDINGNPGIQFNYSITSSQYGDSTNLSTVQICDLLTVTTKQFNSDTGSYTTFEYSIPNDYIQPYNCSGPLLDTEFPYPPLELTPTADMCQDSPDYTAPPPAGSGFGQGDWFTQNVIVSETFTHDVLFSPSNVLIANYAPLSQLQWGWNAEADNGFFGFSLTSSAQLPPTAPIGSDLSTLPIWNNNAYSSWNNPQWWVAP
ncbi:MAG TPA: hypothetical protein VMG59_02490 [Phycisphaerae bacterium]|nr:hypothetical protein [Phycisphaerae bacterium]